MDTRIGLVVGGIGVTSVVPGAAVCARAIGQPGDIAVVNGTPVDATGAGFMAARSSDAPSNNTLGDQAVSNWNFAPGSVDPNVAFAEIGPDGMICVDNSNHATVQIVLDQAGYLPAGQFTPAATTGAARLVDTRRDFIAPPPIGGTTTTTTTTTTTVPQGATAPGAPEGLTGTPGPGSVTLSWTPALSDGGAPVDGYRVERSVGDTSQWQDLATTTSTTYVDEYLDPAAVHFYRVSAHNAVGWGAPSGSIGVTPDTPEQPSQPLALTIVPGTTSLTAQWQPPASDGGAPITGYYAQLRSGLCNGTFVTEVSTASTSVVFAGLKTGDVYCILVGARNEYLAGGPASAAATVGAPAMPSPCTLTLDAYPTQAGTIQWDANVSWSTPVSNGTAAITAYQAQLYRNDSYYGALNAGPADRYTTFQDVPPSGSYRAEVFAYNGMFSPRCVTATVTP